LPVGQRSAQPTAYKPELDVLRFVAFLGVFLVHGVSYPVAHLVSHHMPEWLAQALVSLVHAGMFGVDLFLVLSAYLITDLLVRERTARGSVDVGAFYVRRILRIWPAYLFFILLVMLVPAVDPHREFGLRYALPFLVFLGNWSFVFLGWPASVAVPLWSVSVEEQFYLLWPPVVARLSRRGMVVTSICLIVVANVARLVGVAEHASTEKLWGNTLAHLDSIAAGILLALYLGAASPRLTTWKRTALLAGGVLCLAGRGHYMSNRPDEYMSFLGTLAGYPAVVLGCTALLVAFLGCPMRLPALQYLGKISYGLYVYHMMCLSFTDRYLPKAAGATHLCLRLGVALAATVATAAVSYAVLEKPFLKLKRRFTYIEARPA
jgi:peptidoglycan/LPS O-acetylase OafA/YrhL